LPIAIGGGVLKQYDAERVQLRCFRKPPLFLDNLDGTAAPPASVNDERVYVADVFFLPGFERPQLNKIGEARDVAPVTRPSATGGQEKIPSGKEDSSKASVPATPPVRNPLLPINPLPRPPNAPSSGESKN
jgi:hypothetical protein